MRRLKIRHFAIAAVLTAALTACGDKQEQPAEGDASGEVLEGTISDDMLPLERLESRAPLAEPSAAPSGSATVDSDAEPAADATDGASSDGAAEASSE